MTEFAIGLVSLVALLSVLLLLFVLRKKNTPQSFWLMHLLLAATGLTLLFLYAVHATPRPWESLTLFGLAISVGMFLGIRDFVLLRIPKWLVLGHSLVAFAGYCVLVYSIFFSSEV